MGHRNVFLSQLWRPILFLLLNGLHKLMRLADTRSIINQVRQILLSVQAILDQTREVDGSIETRACGQLLIGSDFGSIIFECTVISVCRVDDSAILVDFKFIFLLLGQIELLLLFLAHQSLQVVTIISNKVLLNVILEYLHLFLLDFNAEAFLGFLFHRCDIILAL